MARAFCSLRGHNPLPHFEPGRVCLRCVDCGHETPGWTIGSPRLRT